MRSKLYISKQQIGSARSTNSWMVPPYCLNGDEQQWLVDWLGELADRHCYLLGNLSAANE